MDAAEADPMVALEGGRFRMGSDDHYAEEGPSRPVAVRAFRIDRAPVTNRRFAAFVAATGHVTVAEQAPDPALYPGADPAMLVPGSLVFAPPSREATHWGDWWRWVPGACWRRPDGRRALDAARADHPVVQVACADAEAYAAWAGLDLPTEAEWEFAARGGLEGAEYGWGEAFMPDGRRMANTWPGTFPRRGAPGPDRYGTSRVGAFPPNGFGLLDMIGNVWEWTADWWAPRHAPAAAKPCCIPLDPRAADRAASLDPAQPAIPIPRRVIKGGSHLCAPNYCRRYRPAARQPQMIDSAASHIGFRCVRRDATPGRAT